MIQEAIGIIAGGKDLSAGQMRLVMEEIMGAKAQTPEIINFLTALEKKGVTAQELTAAVEVMRQYAVKLPISAKVILDTCGTGGDRKNTFNVSTAAAFVASGAGITVAKHGNRSVSSKSGSADILEALGVNLNLPAQGIERCLKEVGIAFLFAQNFHPAMKFAMPARRQIAGRTIFNLLGPLSNPAGATHQMVGVYGLKWLDIFAQALLNLGTQHALVVSSEDGLDEISIAALTHVAEVKGGQINKFEITPQDYGILKSSLDDIRGGSAQENAEILLSVLKGEAGPCRDIVLLNSAAAIYAADKAVSIKEGMELAGRSVDSGAALKKLELLREFS